MERTENSNKLVRWIVAALAAILASIAALYFGVFIRVLSPLPATLSEPTAGFVAGILSVLPAALLTPQRNKTIALCLAAIGTTIWTLLEFPLLSCLVGSACAALIVVWWCRRDRTMRSTLVGFAVLGLTLTGAIVFASAIFRDKYARPEPLPADLVRMLGNKANQIRAFYRYDRGGFIDHEWLWRIDGTPEAIATLTEAMELEPAGTVPAQFWQMPPDYWPRAMPANGEAFKSQMFSADDRGPDGNHYFLVHDKAQGRAFVWEKANF